MAYTSPAIGTVALLRHRRLRWGATQEEQHGTLAGDELLSGVDISATRAITTNAVTDAVWPWITQAGQGRGTLVSCLMSQKMLRGIKSRAEQTREVAAHSPRIPAFERNSR